MTNGDPTFLNLLLLEGADRAPDEVIVLPIGPGSETETIAETLLSGVEQSRRLLLPAPAQSAATDLQRRWHRDLWNAMDAGSKNAVGLVAGHSAGFLSPVLEKQARTLIFVRAPLDALRALPDPTPKLRALERLSEAPPAEIPPRLRAFANPQARALLAPRHDVEELAVTFGPGADAERWRQALFEETLPSIEARPLADAPEAAREIAAALGGRPKLAAQAARSALEDAVAVEEPPRDDLLLELNWLDAELYERCSEAR